jgi:hypothetical protein
MISRRKTSVKCFIEPKIQLITTLLRPQECHVKRSVSQLLGLLFPSPAHKLTPLEAVLVYQHFFVLKCLMEGLSRVQDYVQEQFEEEFRFVTREAEIQNRSMISRRVQLLQQVGIINKKFWEELIAHVP